MCGIVGFRSNNEFPLLRESLPRAVSTISYRGPDDSGLFYDEASGIGLGHRRLSVIDLSSAGHQPMQSDDGRVSIVYSGEVYNFKEIRASLRSHGPKFNTRTDTEVILKAYLERGIDCLHKQMLIKGINIGAVL